MPGEAQESSAAWNNAGTGHAANCELNYTPMRADGSIDIAKALEVNVEFDMSRQFWSYLIKKGAIASPDNFIHPVPHMSFVIGADRQAFLKKRHAAMSAHHCYHGMEYSEDHAQDRRMGAADHGGPRSQAAGRRHPHRERRRRELRRAHHQPAGLPQAPGQFHDPLLADGDRSAPPAGRRLAPRGQERDHRREADDRRPLSSSWAPAARRSRCCRSPASPRPRASRASR